MPPYFHWVNGCQLKCAQGVFRSGERNGYGFISCRKQFNMMKPVNFPQNRTSMFLLTRCVGEVRVLVIDKISNNSQNISLTATDFISYCTFANQNIKSVITLSII